MLYLHGKLDSFLTFGDPYSPGTKSILHTHVTMAIEFRQDIVLYRLLTETRL